MVSGHSGIVSLYPNVVSGQRLAGSSHYSWRKWEIMGVLMLPIGSMGRLYIYLQIYLIKINYIDAGKYTSPMDPLGYKPHI